MRSNPDYAQMEGVVAGVPSLADYDVIIDAGSDRSDPANAVPFSVRTPAGRTFEQPGNFFTLIGFVLVVMVGQPVRTMQGTGWLPITPLDVTLPYWSGLWFGVYPTLETVGAQLAAIVFVVGSYFHAQELKVKRPRRRAGAAGAARGSGARARARSPRRRSAA